VKSLGRRRVLRWILTSDDLKQNALRNNTLNAENPLSQFLELAEEWSLGYSKIVRTYLAFNRGGNWHLEHLTIMFFSDFFDESVSLLLPKTVKTNSLLAVKEVIDFKDKHLDVLLDKESFDPFVAPNGEFEITVPIEDRSKLSYYFEPFTRREFPRNWRYPTLTTSAGSTLTNHHLPSRDQLDLELLGNDLPYSGLNELLSTFGVPHTVMQQGYSSPQAIWIISHPAVIMQSSSIENEIANIEIRCPISLDHQNMSVGIRALTGQPPIVRKNIPTSKIEWTIDGCWRKGVISEPVEATAAADIHLSYRGNFLGHHWISDQKRSLNPRHLLHKLSDNKDVIGLKFFNQKADHFEDCVSLLLNLLGLTAITYGGIPSLKDAPDILAYSPHGHLFVIECTTTDVGRSGKLLKLSQRTREIKDAANQGGIGYPHILPVMFTTLFKEETKACWDEAAGFGIALICQENIQNLIERIEGPPTPQELYDAALAEIPAKNGEQGTLFQNNQ